MIHPTLPYLHRTAPGEYRYRDSAGRRWTITADAPPVPTRIYDWCATDGSGPDGLEHYAETLEGVVAKIEEGFDE